MKTKVEKTLKEIKERILFLENSKEGISETDTRQGLINPLFRSLEWDFGDFQSVKSELRHKNYNEPVDYAFFSLNEQTHPILLLEAKSFGKNLNSGKHVKQLCNYLGEMGVQWGVLSDGNKYIMYNSNGGRSYEDWKFLTLCIKDVDTDDGLSCEDLADKFIALLSRGCLENKDIQQTYEEHMIDMQIEGAMTSLFSEPFDTLAQSIKREFREERVTTNENLKISPKRIISYLKNLADEDGKILIDTSSSNLEESDGILQSVSEQNEIDEIDETDKIDKIVKSKRISISDLMDENLVSENDNWKLTHKGEVFWGRITGNGEIEVNGKNYPNPSATGRSFRDRGVNGWVWWRYKDPEKGWIRIETLRARYREKHGLLPMTMNKKLKV